MLKYLGEIDCFEDLANIVGEDDAIKAWRGKANYFRDLSNAVFGVGDYEADCIIAIDNFILQLEDLRKKMEDADTFFDILNVIS